MKIVNVETFVSSVALFADITFTDAKIEIDRSKSLGLPIWTGLVRSGKLSLFDLYVAALGSCDGTNGTTRRTIELDESDALPIYDTVIPAKNWLIACTDRSDPALRTFVLCDMHSPSYSGGVLDRFIASLAENDRVVVGVLVLPTERIMVAASASESLAKKSGTEPEEDNERAFDSIASAAIKLNASDIHITVGNGVTDIAFRIDGELGSWRKQPLTEERGFSLLHTLYNSLAERSSVSGDFNATKEQDAVIERVYDHGRVRFRYSQLPVEPRRVDVTLRIIHVSGKMRFRPMTQLGYSPDEAAALDRMFAKSGGLILFAGTTGSGKSTSMANKLTQYTLENPGKKVRTVEEPVEYMIPGAFQTSVRRLKGNADDFLKVLRQMMRSDPDVLMIGEIRDFDTANLTIQGVRSGHLSISTIHANSATVCYDRLAGMGIGRLDLASVGLVHGLVYQKLVQVLCPHCKINGVDYRAAQGDNLEPVQKRLDHYLVLFDGNISQVYWRNPSGCEHCGHRGITGREVCAEILIPRPEMLSCIASGDSSELWKLWRKTIRRDDPGSMMGRTAFEHALFKMMNGRVSPKSVESEFSFLDDLEFLYVDQELREEGWPVEDVERALTMIFGSTTAKLRTIA